MKKISTPNPVDLYVGARLRMRRVFLDISQEKLSDAIGITFQQIQKYEKGTNRVSASRIYELSKALDVDISYFFEDFDESALKDGKLLESPAMSLDIDIMERKETFDIVKNYYKISNLKVRKKITELLKSLAESEDA
ncbi:MAG: helix-turn-helix domain-containing protein [Alphaproteobacteria bacterium]